MDFGRKGTMDLTVGTHTLGGVGGASANGATLPKKGRASAMGIIPTNNTGSFFFGSGAVTLQGKSGMSVVPSQMNPNGTAPKRETSFFMGKPASNTSGAPAGSMSILPTSPEAGAGLGGGGDKDNFGLKKSDSEDAQLKL